MRDSVRGIRDVVASILVCVGAACGGGGGEPAAVPGFDLAEARFVDLTHAYDASTVYWPTSPTSFELDTLAYGPTPGGWFYSSFALSTPEHGGTHLDAPIHFAEGRDAADAVPLDRLIAPVAVIDVSAKAAEDVDYRMTAEDILEFEGVHGRIQPGTIVLMRTDWSRRWPDRKAYLGDDTPGNASGLHFPGLGEGAARLLVEERSVAAIGVDVASIDYGASADFVVHQIVNGANIPDFENLTNLDQLPPTGAWLMALPMKIGGGSGGPLRAVAAVPPSR